MALMCGGVLVCEGEEQTWQHKKYHPVIIIQAFCCFLPRQEADLALGPFITSDARERMADMSVSFYRDTYVVISPRPTLSSDPAGLIKTFTPFVR